MPEVFGWPEGSVRLWTGTATASALVAYAEQTNVMLTRGFNTTRTLDGEYHDKQTGRRANVSVGTLYTHGNSALWQMFEAGTAVHMHFRHDITGGGSAGVYLYSGRIDTLQTVGQAGDVYRLMMTYHANRWSAYP